MWLLPAAAKSGLCLGPNPNEPNANLCMHGAGSQKWRCKLKHMQGKWFANIPLNADTNPGNMFTVCMIAAPVAKPTPRNTSSAHKDDQMQSGGMDAECNGCTECTSNPSAT